MKVVDQTESDAGFITAARSAIDQGADLRLSVAGHDITVDGDVAQALITVMEQVSAGASIEITRHDAELTTGQAADLLGVSRPTVVELVDSGKLPGHMVGTHRRILASDALAYRDQRGMEFSAALDELVNLSEELGIYDD